MKKSYSEMLPFIGDLNQLISCKESVLSGGFQEGVKCIHVNNGGNISATILPGRSMDIYQVRYKGKNLNYIAPSGIIASEYYEAQGFRWLRNFFVGFLTTCGLQHIGSPAVINGEEVGLHGRISNTPAENVTITRGSIADVPSLSIEGTMREGRIFGENLTLKRKLDFLYEDDAFTITDTITNHGFGERQYLYSLHLNYGYPLLNKGAQIIMDTEDVEPREEHAAKFIDSWIEIEEPQYPYPERCYFHNVKPDNDGISRHTLFNPDINIGVNVQYKHEDFPYFVQWKMLGKGEYVLGLEPLNTPLDGPKLGEEGCKAPVLQPGESRDYTYSFKFIDKL
ncbi:MAG: aldose 1-epimerase family protein [Saccharofermentanales bacterium]